MKFANPNIFYIVLAAVCAAAFLLWSERARARALLSFAQKDLLQELLKLVDTRRRTVKNILWFTGFVLCLAALARPQWGFRWQKVSHRGLDILIAVDTSKSMLAADVKPNRLERTKLAVTDLTGKLNGDRVGLIAFAGSAFLQCPLTIDYSGFALTVQSLSTDTIPRGGTSLSGAVQEALRAFSGGDKKYKVLIVITDGESHEGDPMPLVEQARKDGVIIHCIGIGTPEGELISVADGGQPEFLKDTQGNVVKSRLNEEILKKMALATGGSYVRASPTEFGLELLYNEKLSKMEKREFEGRMNKLFEERFQIPLALGLLLLCVEMLLSDRKQ
jgi:Ca-activated chloride channel family protein